MADQLKDGETLEPLGAQPTGRTSAGLKAGETLEPIQRGSSSAAGSSEPEPFASSRFGQGVKRGVLNILHGGKEIGADLITRPTPVLTGEDSMLNKYILGPAAHEKERSIQEAATMHDSRGIESVGHGLTSMIHTAGEFVPVVGPIVGSLVDRAREGDIAGAVGEGATYALAPKVARGAGAKAIDVVRDVPGVRTLIPSAGGAGRAIGSSPTVGPIIEKAINTVSSPEPVRARAIPIGGPAGPIAPAVGGPAEIPQAIPMAPKAEVSSETIPRTLQGESVLRQVLTGQDNKNLLKIARSRGINVTAEAQLKPGIADSRIINKIIDDFSPEELDELRSQGVEVSRFQHNFGNVGPEAHQTIGMQTYFPDLKIPQAVMTRTQAAITRGAQPAEAGPIKSATTPRVKPVIPVPETSPPGEDLTPILQKSLQTVSAANPSQSLLGGQASGAPSILQAAKRSLIAKSKKEVSAIGKRRGIDLTGGNDPSGTGAISTKGTAIDAILNDLSPEELAGR